MGRKVDVDDLVGAAEIAERLGLAHSQTVHTIRRRHADFPDPIATLKRAHVWSWRDVERWAKATGRATS
jgi:predicted DNA-binding transcriptional regulator AlpA